MKTLLTIGLGIIFILGSNLPIQANPASDYTRGIICPLCRVITGLKYKENQVYYNPETKKHIILDKDEKNADLPIE